MARKASGKKSDSSANLGFEATQRSLKGNLWLSADSRGEAEPERSGDSPARIRFYPGQTAEGNRSNAFSYAA